MMMMNNNISLLYIILLLITTPILIHCHEHIHAQPYNIGDAVDIICPNHILTCHETDRPISFIFGEDAFVHCSWSIKDIDVYNYASSIVKQEDSWQCKIALDKTNTIYIPISIPLWGLVELTHMHINYHLNFIFHIDNNYIIGASIYPIRDQFQMVQVGSLLSLHGAVKWFNKHTYVEYNHVSDITASNNIMNNMISTNITNCSIVSVLLYTVFVSLTIFIICMIIYIKKLKPRLIKKYLKSD